MNTSAGSCMRPEAVFRLSRMSRSRSCPAAKQFLPFGNKKARDLKNFSRRPKKNKCRLFQKKPTPRPSALRQLLHFLRKGKDHRHIQKNFAGLPLAPRREIDKPAKCYLHYCGLKRQLAPCPATCRAAVGISSRSFCYRKSADIRPSSRRSWRSACR